MAQLDDLLRQVLEDKGLDPKLAEGVLQPQAELPAELRTAVEAVVRRLEQGHDNAPRKAEGDGADGQEDTAADDTADA